MCAEHSTVRGILENLPQGEGKVTVLDMGATPEPFSRGTLRPVDVMLLVAEPYYKSLEAVVRMDKLARELGIENVKIVANKVRDDEQREAIEQICASNNLDLIKMLPWDELFQKADLRGVAPLDLDGQGDAAIAHLEDLADRIAALVTQPA